MRKVIAVGVLGVLTGLHIMSFGQRKNNMTRQEYIDTYSELAMKEMVRVGIPASITLAQGCLESNNGNSTLARKGNNHFGIKCHDWTGRKIYHDDDKKNECFRAYNSPYQSFIDHSEFLTTRSRYEGLFELPLHDYRGWARGLKQAGYATAPDYARLLIQIIEDNELYNFDLLVLEGGIGTEIDSAALLPDHGYTTSREVFMNNGIEYVKAQPGDTPESIRREMELYPNEIYRYNNFYRGQDLEEGQIVYLQPKRRKAARGNEVHEVAEGETMYDISQKYGVKIKHLYRLNKMKEGAQPLPGTKIYLRRKRPGPVQKQERVPEPEWDEEMRFEFSY